jgi:hypothetical protein
VSSVFRGIVDRLEAFAGAPFLPLSGGTLSGVLDMATNALELVTPTATTNTAFPQILDNALSNVIYAGGHYVNTTSLSWGYDFTDNVATVNIDGITQFTQISTPTVNPPSGNNDLYFKSDNNLYMLNSSGTETKVNGGSAAGSTTDIQYNNSGAFGGSGNFTWTAGTNTLAVNGIIHAENTSGVARIIVDAMGSYAVFDLYNNGSEVGYLNYAAGANQMQFQVNGSPVASIVIGQANSTPNLFLNVGSTQTYANASADDGTASVLQTPSLSINGGNSGFSSVSSLLTINGGTGATGSTVADIAGDITVGVDGSKLIFTTDYQSGFPYVAFGDISTAVNGTKLFLDDSAQQITLKAGNGIYTTYNSLDDGTGNMQAANNITALGEMYSNAFITSGGSSSQFVKGNGSLDSTTYASTTGTQTLTNKRITRRVGTASAPGATPSLDTDNYDQYNFTGLATAITSMSTNLTGSPSSEDIIVITFVDNGTARAITWGASFASSGTVPLPLTTVVSTVLNVILMYNGSVWVCLGVA